MSILSLFAWAIVLIILIDFFQALVLGCIDLCRYKIRRAIIMKVRLEKREFTQREWRILISFMNDDSYYQLKRNGVLENRSGSYWKELFEVV